jgi:segregation and condensation protein A
VRPGNRQTRDHGQVSQEPTNYRVSLDVYAGPLDLLLYLIRREEVDIHDIPISRITSQYIQYVEMLRQLDPDSIGQFLVLAATLMEIKSRTLLPTPPEEVAEEDAIDPRADLVRQLLEYKRFKDAAGGLQQQADDFARRFPRAPGQSAAEDPFDLDDAEVWDLLAAFNNLMLQTGRTGYQHQVIYDDTPVATHALNVVDYLQKQGGSAEFGSLFAGKSRSQCVGMFLALLELIRRARVRADQDHPFGQIYVFLLDPRPLTAPEVAESFGPEGPMGPALAGTEAAGVHDPPGVDDPGAADDQATTSQVRVAPSEQRNGDQDDTPAAGGQAQGDGLQSA